MASVLSFPGAAAAANPLDALCQEYAHMIHQLRVQIVDKEIKIAMLESQVASRPIIHIAGDYTQLCDFVRNNNIDLEYKTKPSYDKIVSAITDWSAKNNLRILIGVSESAEKPVAETTPVAEDPSINQTDDMYAVIAKQIGSDHIHCSHCHGAKPLQNFSGSLKKHFKDGVLTRVPKVCDRMLELNKRWNTLNNAINNTKTSIKKHKAWLEEATEESKRAQLIAKLAALDQKLAAAIKAKEDHLAKNVGTSFTIEADDA